jgi:hypothetical protein
VIDAAAETVMNRLRRTLWLYHGSHLQYGVRNLSADLRTASVISYDARLASLHY